MGRGRRSLPCRPASGGERSASPRSCSAGRGPARRRRALLSRPALNRMSHCWRKQLEIHREPLASGTDPGGGAGAADSCQLRPRVTPGGGHHPHTGWMGLSISVPRLSEGCSSMLSQPQGGRRGVGGLPPRKACSLCPPCPRLFDSQAITLFPPPPPPPPSAPRTKPAGERGLGAWRPASRGGSSSQPRSNLPRRKR